MYFAYVSLCICSLRMKEMRRASFMKYGDIMEGDIYIYRSINRYLYHTVTHVMIGHSQFSYRTRLISRHHNNFHCYETIWWQMMQL